MSDLTFTGECECCGKRFVVKLNNPFCPVCLGLWDRLHDWWLSTEWDRGALLATVVIAVALGFVALLPNSSPFDPARAETVPVDDYSLVMEARECHGTLYFSEDVKSLVSLSVAAVGSGELVYTVCYRRKKLYGR
jgi:hypothetical protein